MAAAHLPERSFPSTAPRRPASETIFTIFLFFFLFSQVSDLGSVSSESGGGNAFRQSGYVFFLGLSFVVYKVFLDPARLFSALPATMLLFLTWCALSIFWALDPAIAFRRFILTAVVIFTIFMLVKDLGYERSVRAIRFVLPFVLLVSLALVMLIPSIGMHQPDDLDPLLAGAWRGVFPQKNSLGLVCAIALLFFLFDARALRGWFRWSVIALALLLLVNSTSKTSGGLFLIAALSGWLWSGYRRTWRIPVLHLLVLMMFAAVLVSGEVIDWVSEILLDDMAFTGRTRIWLALTKYVHENWMFGSGFGSFWNISGDAPIAFYATGWVTNVALNGHNGYLDLVVQVGMPGFLLAILAVIVHPVWRVLKMDIRSFRGSGLVVALLVFAFLHNLTETTMFDRDSILHVFLMIGIALIEVGFRDGDPRAGMSRHIGARNNPGRP